MPALGAEIDKGRLVEWRVKPGDVVSRGQVIAIVETDKGAVEVEVWEDGVIERLDVQPPAEVPIGTVLATLAAGGAGAKPAAPPTPTPAPAPVPHAAAPHAAAPLAGAGPSTAHVSAVPSARARARELGIDLASVPGTGPHGSITRDDVDRAASAIPAATQPPVAKEGAPAEPMRRAIAAAMSRSKREIPHYYLSTRIDLSHALAWLDSANRERSVEKRLLPIALLVRAVARAARAFPGMNGYFRDGAFHAAESVHVGLVVSLRQGGLVVPAIHDADTLDAGGLMERISSVIQRSRRGALRSSELSDSTLTITNLGEGSTEAVFPVIFPPQVAIVGFGRIAPEAWAHEDSLAVRPVVHATLAADHRVSDGHRGAQFLSAIDRQLQETPS